jgi:ABC-type glycerol-3-phosphate transport system substrate-binding protein
MAVRMTWLAAAVLLAGAGACADDAGAVPVEVPAPGATTATAEHVLAAGHPGKHERTVRFVARVRADYPGMTVDQRDEEIVAIADQTCTALASDTGSAAVVARVRELGAPDDATARKLIRMSIDIVCPDQDRHVGDF